MKISNGMKKILITGGSGMVGSAIPFGIKPKKKELDFLKKNSIEKAIKKYKPDILLHLGAMTDMLKCEENPKKATRINVQGSENLAKICKENNIKLVYMSTCAVFDGKKTTPYDEKDIPKPINIYGKTKLAGEKIVKKILPNSLIIRTGWLFGGNKKDKKFVGLTIEKFKNKTEVSATNDRFGSFTYIPDLLKETQKLIEDKKSGTFHITNSGVASYFDMAKEIKKLGNFKSEVVPKSAKELQNPKVKRGKMEALKSSKIKLRPWQKALREYMN